jgi:hypothetical protein
MRKALEDAAYILRQAQNDVNIGMPTELWKFLRHAEQHVNAELVQIMDAEFVEVHRG